MQSFTSISNPVYRSEHPHYRQGSYAVIYKKKERKVTQTQTFLTLLPNDCSKGFTSLRHTPASIEWLPIFG